MEKKYALNQKPLNPHSQQLGPPLTHFITTNVLLPSTPGEKSHIEHIVLTLYV